MAGEDEIDERREALLAEGARLGEGFGLGACTGAWTARRRHQAWGCGTTLPAFACGAGALVIAPHGTPLEQKIGAIVCACLAVPGALLMALSPPAAWDRLFRYPGGLAQVVDALLRRGHWLSQDGWRHANAPQVIAARDLYPWTVAKVQPRLPPAGPGPDRDLAAARRGP